MKKMRFFENFFEGRFLRQRPAGIFGDFLNGAGSFWPETSEFYDPGQNRPA